MKTKNIFKALALAMLMPATLLTTACSSNDDDAIVNNNENTNKEGYPLQVTVNVTRQGDATTRATYNASDKKLEFSSGDQLFVDGIDSSDGGAGQFAGALDYVDGSGGTFTGTITVENGWNGTADALFTAAQASNYVRAILLPNGYGVYDYLYIYQNNGYNANVIPYAPKAFALTKKLAVEQFSNEYASSYSSGTGFALSPLNAILNFTITGLTANATANVALGGALTISKEVTTDGSGNATFAVGISGGTDLKDLSLTVDDDNAITLTSSSITLTAGKIYNISRSAVPAPSYTVGHVICTDGSTYATKSAATDAGKTPVAVIAYVGSSTGDATHNHGLAIALVDESGTNVNNGTTTWVMNWSTAKSTCEGKTAVTGAKWYLPSLAQWETMFSANSNSASCYTGLNETIHNAGGTELGIKSQGYLYWTSTEVSEKLARGMMLQDDYAYFYSNDKVYTQHVRACLAF